MSDAVIVGAGIFGLSCAVTLADRGWTVTLIDRDLSWQRASSGGDTRLMRLSHGGDDWHRDSARRARRGWLEWAERTGTELLRETGVVWMSNRTDGWVGRSRAALLAAGDPIEDLGEDQLGALLPGVNPAGIEMTYLELSSGVLFADRTREGLLSLLRSLGARIVSEAVRNEDGVPVGRDEPHRADVTIWACGPWLEQLFPGLVNIEVTQQDLVNVAAPIGWRNAPAWIDLSTTWYGTGDVGTGVKVADDRPGPRLDPTASDRRVDDQTVDGVRQFLEHRFPSMHQMPVVATRVCQYSRTRDSEFIVAAHLHHEDTWIVGGGSGHGFKHGPAFGEYVADVVEGVMDPLPRHGLAPRPSSAGLRMDGG